MDSDVRRRHGSEQERGAVLLISIAILVLLSLFATAFVRLVNFERRASTNYTDAVRARLLAKAGIEDAVGRLRQIVDKRHYLDPRDDRWRFRLVPPDAAKMTDYGLRLDLMTTTAPSFALDYAGQIGTGRYGGDFYYLGKPIAVSGIIAQTYSDGLDVYKLKVVDAASQLNLNHPDEHASKRMLATLLRQSAALDPGWALTQVQAERIASHVIDHRPAIGFQSKAEILQLLLAEVPGVPKARLVTDDRWLDASAARPALRDMITLYSWVDESVIQPWNLNGEAKRALEVMPRAPVGLNSAPLPVLTAIFAGLKAENDYGTFFVGYKDADRLAKAIIERRELGEGPFRSWPEFETWLDTFSFAHVKANSESTDPELSWWTAKSVDLDPRGLVPDPLFYEDVSPTWAALHLNQGLRDLVKAMLNPNTMLNKFGAGANHGGSKLPSGIWMPRLVDKADLVQITTEGCFDSGGVFEVTSLGMLLERDPARALVPGEHEVVVTAAHTIQSVVRVYDILRLTTQADFERHRALMVPGDWIPDSRAWRDLAGYNRREFKSHPGWPGMVTHPVYSLARKPGEQNHAIRDEFAPATYDGHVTLSNLLGISIEKHDFLAGFSRGSINAFKARVWWDPKDQYPGTGEPIQSNAPSQPFGATPKRSPNGEIVGANNEPLGVSLSSWYDREGGEWPNSPDWAELDRLVKAKQPAPRMAGQRGGVPDLLDSTPAAAAVVDDQRFWYEGSSLWNNGVALGPYRNWTATDKPAVLAFDSDNLNLQTGCSIRFWVQPTVDPYLRDEEVLFSFVGSQDGVKRETGFRVVKRATPGGVSIVLQAVPSGGMGGNPSGFGTDLTSVTRYRWHSEDLKPSGLWKSTVEIDVTPRFSLTAAEIAARKGPLRDKSVDPFNPEWLPHSWHWVVINYGYTGRMEKDKLEGSVILPQIDMSLQVDMSPTQPPKGLTVAEGADRIAFRGQPQLNADKAEGYGQLHGHDTTVGVNHGHPDLWIPLGWATSYHPAGEGGKIGTTPKAGPLGDEYQSPETGGHAGEATPPGTKTAGWVPPEPKSGRDKVTEITYHWHWYVNWWVTPRLLGDFYHCGLGAPVISQPPKKEVIPDAIAYLDDEYKFRDPKDGMIPVGAFGPSLTCEFRDESGNLVTSFKDPNWTPGDGETEADRPVFQLGNPPGSGRVPFVYTKSGWKLTLGGSGRQGEFGTDRTPGGSHEWKLALIKEYRVFARDGCSCCVAKQDDPNWGGLYDGAYMRRKEAAPANDESNAWPNGCFHDSGQMTIHGIPPHNGENGKPCMVLFHSQLKGHQLNTNLPGPSILPPEGLCDDCHGCEGCDVDGPMFLGGEPAGPRNYNSDGVLADINQNTVAYAVFDNFVALNNPWYRTDYVKNPDDPDQFEVEWYEDRFFTGKLNEEYVTEQLNGEPSSGYGAVFRRGLLELLGTRGRLGTITWTTYPSSDGFLALEPSVWRLRAMDGAQPRWRGDNADLLASKPGDKKWGPADCEKVGDAYVGLAFGEDGAYNGRSDSGATQLVVLGFQLKNMYNSRWNIEQKADGSFDIPNMDSGIPTPIFETPVLEDVTITLIRESAQVLYAEEGASE